MLAPQKGKGARQREEACQPAQCSIISEGGSPDGTTRVSITIHEGKNRQVRRMFEAIGHEVLELERVGIGDVVLGEVETGRTVELTDAELASLERAISRTEHP